MSTKGKLKKKRVWEIFEKHWPYNTIGHTKYQSTVPERVDQRTKQKKNKKTDQTNSFVLKQNVQ